MLGLPLFTSETNVFAMIIITVIAWFVMYVTGLYLMEATLNRPSGANFLSLAQDFLPRGGKGIVLLVYLFLYFSLLVAYLSGGSSIISTLFPSAKGTLLIFALFFFILALIGPKWMDKVNIVFSVAMLIFWFILTSQIALFSPFKFLEVGGAKESIKALPVLFSAFGYHNLIPPLCTYLQRDIRALKRSILLGTLIPCCVYLCWQVFTKAVIPPEVIQSTLQQGLPISIAFERIGFSTSILYCVRGFSFFAIITSLIGVSFSFIDFLADGLKLKRKGIDRFVCTLLTFIPPLLIVVLDPTLFDKALSIAGGFGEALLNGLFPIILVYTIRNIKKYREPYSIGGKNILLYLLALFCLGVMFIEFFLLLD